MKLQENINRIKEMMGLLTEVDQNTLDNLFSKLTEYGFEKKTEEEFKKATGKVLNVYGGWLYFNPKTKIRVYKLGTDDKIFFADDLGYTKTSNSQPIELSINEFVINPPKPKEKTFDDIMFELKKLRNGWKEINLTYDNGKYTYGENKDKELPNNMLGTIKNTLKIRLIEIKNDYNQLSLSNEQKQQINDFINTIETEAKNLNLMS